MIYFRYSKYIDSWRTQVNWVKVRFIRPMNIEDIIFKYINGAILSINPLGDGHINDTFLVETGTGKYVMQRVKGSMDIESCEHNYGLYSRLFEDSGWKYPVWIKNSDGKFFYTDETGSHWRLYSFIDGEILEAPIDDKMLYSCGKGIARMHMILGNIKGSPKAVYPHLHDLRFYHDMYQKILKSGDFLAENRDLAIEEKISAKAVSMLSIEQDSSDVVHGDAKLANILFKSGEVIGFIDFDTLMPGSRLEDLADCIRSCCTKDGVLDKEKAEKIVQGYTDNIPEKMVSGIEKLPDVYDKICFELGLRYYTDAIAKEKVFKEKYPGFRLDRARSLFSNL